LFLRIAKLQARTGHARSTAAGGAHRIIAAGGSRRARAARGAHRPRGGGEQGGSRRRCWASGAGTHAPSSASRPQHPLSTTTRPRGVRAETRRGFRETWGEEDVGAHRELTVRDGSDRRGAECRSRAPPRRVAHFASARTMWKHAILPYASPRPYESAEPTCASWRATQRGSAVHRTRNSAGVVGAWRPARRHRVSALAVPRRPARPAQGQPRASSHRV
jgi:hypothetical protein